MPANRILNVQPIVLGTVAANLLNCAVTSLAGPVGITLTQPYMIISHMRIVNKLAQTVTFSLFKGATGASAAGTEIVGSLTAIAANSSYDWFGMLRMDSGDFLTGLAGTATALTLSVEGEVGFS